VFAGLPDAVLARALAGKDFLSEMAERARRGLETWTELVKVLTEACGDDHWQGTHRAVQSLDRWAVVALSLSGPPGHDGGAANEWAVDAVGVLKAMIARPKAATREWLCGSRRPGLAPVPPSVFQALLWPRWVGGG
jgi:hypothetical protein